MRSNPGYLLKSFLLHVLVMYGVLIIDNSENNKLHNCIFLNLFFYLLKKNLCTGKHKDSTGVILNKFHDPTLRNVNNVQI